LAKRYTVTPGLALAPPSETAASTANVPSQHTVRLNALVETMKAKINDDL